MRYIKKYELLNKLHDKSVRIAGENDIIVDDGLYELLDIIFTRSSIIELLKKENESKLIKFLIMDIYIGRHNINQD